MVGKLGKMGGKLRKIGKCLVGIAPFSGLVMASTPLTTAGAAVSIADGTGGVIALFGVIITGLAVMWGIRKMIKTTNRS